MMKFKEKTKFKSFTKSDLIRRQSYANESDLPKTKLCFKEYMDEVFAGLIWLG